jgi:hypothetical protein
MSDIEQYFKDLQGTVFNDEVWSSAPCSQLGDPDMWFDIDTHASNERIDHLRIALSICNSCHLRSECLELGMQGEDLLWGIWGGLFSAERQVLAGNGHYFSVQRGLQAANTLRRKTGVAKPTTQGDSNE